MKFGSVTLRPEPCIVLGNLAWGRQVRLTHRAAEAWKRFWTIRASLCSRAAQRLAPEAKGRSLPYPHLGGGAARLGT